MCSIPQVPEGMPHLIQLSTHCSLLHCLVHRTCSFCESSEHIAITFFRPFIRSVHHNAESRKHRQFLWELKNFTYLIENCIIEEENFTLIRFRSLCFAIKFATFRAN